MDINRLRQLLTDFKNEKINIDETLNSLKSLPFEDIEFAKIDHHRGIRNGYPEVIYCQGKTVDQVRTIVRKLAENDSNIMATRADKAIYEGIKEVAEDAVYFETARIVLVNRKEAVANNKVIAVITGGTSDIHVAEEAAVTAEAMGNKVVRLYDVGVAGIHRLFDNIETIMSANVLIVAAGMEGALASVVGGLVDKPVIAVPTSIGYGASFGGLAALLAMLNSCASGVCVVNIDNGFGAGYLASMINKL